MSKKQSLRMLLIAFMFFFAAAAAVTFNVPAAKVRAEGQQIFMNQSAAIRTEENSGIRFYGQMSDECYDSDPYEFGVKITFEYEGAHTVERAIDKTTVYQKDGVWTYNVVIANLPEDAYNTDFTVKSYVQMTEESEKIYSDDEVTHSIAYIAGLAEKDNPTENSFFDNIINKAAENFTLQESEITLNEGGSRKIVYQGTKVTYVTYESENDEIAMVSDDGMITAISEGSTVIKVTIGDNVRECSVTVEPVAPVDLGKFEVELPVAADTYITGDSVTAPETMQAALATAAADTLFQKYGTETAALTYDSETKTLSGLKAGEQTLITFTDSEGQAYTATVNVCTLIIENKADLKLMTTIMEANKVRTGGNGSGETPTFTTGGYFVLKNDIPFDPVWDPAFQSDFTLYASNYYDYANNGFTGVFDGRGYAISDIKVNTLSKTDDVTGATLRSVGLFTYIDGTAVIKNVEIIGYSNVNQPYGTLLANVVEGTVKNVSVTHQGMYSDKGAYIQNTGTLFGTVKDTAILENIILNIEADTMFSGSECGLITSRMETATVRGVYVIAPSVCQRSDSGSLVNMTWCVLTAQNDRMMTSLTNGEGAFYASLENFTNGTETILSTDGTFNEGAHDAWSYINANFSADIWDLTDTDGLPVLKPQA